MIVPTLCVTLALALRSREQIVSVYKLLPRKLLNCRPATRRVRQGCYYNDRADRSNPQVASRSDRREYGSAGSAPTVANRAAEAFRRSREQMGSVCIMFAKTGLINNTKKDTIEPVNKIRFAGGCT